MTDTQWNIRQPLLAVGQGTSSLALLLAQPGQLPGQWIRAVLPATGSPEIQINRFSQENGIACPHAVIIANSGATGLQSPGLSGAERMRFWQDELKHTGGQPEDSIKTACNKLISCDECYLADLASAFALAALSVDELRNRSWNEGVTAIWAGSVHTLALLIFREKICAVYEHKADYPASGVSDHIRQLQLSWLPDEHIRQTGGNGCVIGEMPPEAEGFKPAWILGPNHKNFATLGRFRSVCADDCYTLCFGLIYGYLKKSGSSNI